MVAKVASTDSDNVRSSVRVFFKELLAGGPRVERTFYLQTSPTAVA